MEHQEDTGYRENDEEQTGNPSQAERIGELKPVTFYLRREEMEEEVVVDEHGPLQIRIGYPGSENGSPDCRFRNPSKNLFLHLFSSR